MLRISILRPGILRATTPSRAANPRGTFRIAQQAASYAFPGASIFIATDIPARLDRLPWSRWHLRVISALAVTWLLDGLEGSLGGSLAGALKARDGLAFTDAQLGLSSSFYLGGAVLGALVFGYLADRFGRRRLFTWTLLLYLCATAATGLSWNLASFTFFRVLTGAGIGGEYAAINSAVDELVPARLRGRVDLWINATFWGGIILGSIVSSAFLSPRLFGQHLGWRVAFNSGVPLGIVVLFMRRYIPESPRWLLGRGRVAQAEAVMQKIESEVEIAARDERKNRSRFPAGMTDESRFPAGMTNGSRFPAGMTSESDACPAVEAGSSIRRFFSLLLGAYRSRAILCFILMASQAFFYNSVFFSLALVLMRYYGVRADQVGYCFIPIAVTNFLGPVVLGRLFDTLGRRQMIAVTYILSGVALIGSSWMFLHGQLGLRGQVLWWAATFFFASTAASSAYLTVSEVFPQSVRATSIAFFYAFGTLAGGAFGPLLFGRLTASASRAPLFAGYVAGAAAMVFGGLAQALWGVAAERRSLESLTLTGSAEREALLALELQSRIES